jgi:hypothetical protein
MWLGPVRIDPRRAGVVDVAERLVRNGADRWRLLGRFSTEI